MVLRDVICIMVLRDVICITVLRDVLRITMLRDVLRITTKLFHRISVCSDGFHEFVAHVTVHFVIREEDHALRF